MAFKHFAVAAALATAGCTSIVADARTLAGTSWNVVGISGQAVPAGAGFQLQFTGDSVGGYLGCNRFSGSYRIRGDILTIGMMAMSQMACVPTGDEPQTLLEPQGLSVLASPMRMQWRSGRQLRLNNAAGSMDLERLP